MTTYHVYSTVALKWNRKIQCGNSCRRISLPLCLVLERCSHTPHLFFSNTPLPASNNFWTKVQLSTKSDAFLSTNILLSLFIFFNLGYCTVFLKLCYHDIVTFGKKWMYENLVIDSLKTSRFQVLSDHFQCPCDVINTFQGTVPA